MKNTAQLTHLLGLGLSAAALVALFGSAGCRSAASTLMNATEENAGENCTDGGVRLSTGLDENGDSILDDDEVQSISYVCNGGTGDQGDLGASGSAALVDVEAEAPGDNCAAGGVAVYAGLDNGDGGGTADDGVLDAGEVDQTSFVCHGDDGAGGANGADGASGEDGFNSLIAVTEEPVGSECEFGGLRVDVGIDNGDGGGTAGDDTLDAGEIDETEYVCRLGTEQLERTFGGVSFKDGGNSGDHLHSVAVDDGGNIYSCGYFNLGGSGTARVDKTLLDGTVEWTNAETAPIGNIGRRCRVRGDGQVAFATQLKATAGDNSQSIGLYSYNTDGSDAIAAVVFKAGGVESYGSAADVAADGTLYLLAETQGSSKVMLYRFSAAGVEDWSRTVIQGGSSNRATNVLVAHDGSIVVVGYGTGTLTDSDGGTHSTQQSDGFIARYDSSGSLSDFELIGTAGNDYINNVAHGSDGFYICGGTEGGLDGNSLVSDRDWFVQKHTSLGTVAWTTQDGDAAGKKNMCRGIDLAPDGTVYLAGYSDYVGSSDSKMRITSLDGATGAQRWSIQRGADAKFTMATDLMYSLGDVIVGGTTNGELGGVTPDNTDGFVMIVDASSGAIR